MSDLARSKAMYRAGLGFSVLASFEDHAGFDGVILGLPDLSYHLEFTSRRDHPVAPHPTDEDLLVFYLPDPREWERRCAAMLAAGFLRVQSSNPYWERSGCTFEDPDAYRTVLQCASWRDP